MKRRVVVTGGRDYADPQKVYSTLYAMHRLAPITLLIHGACTDKDTGELCGADRFAEEWAIRAGVPYMGVPADWGQFARAAGPIRNQKMADTEPDYVVAFPGGRGTADMVRRARAAGVSVVEVE